jgi:hypothetical protein
MKKLSLKHIHILVAINVLVGILALVWVIQVLWVEEQIFTEPPNDYLGNMNFPAVPIETSAVKAHPLFTQNRLPAPEQPGPDNPDAVKISSPPKSLESSRALKENWAPSWKIRRQELESSCAAVGSLWDGS